MPLYSLRHITFPALCLYDSSLNLTVCDLLKLCFSKQSNSMPRTLPKGGGGWTQPQQQRQPPPPPDDGAGQNRNESWQTKDNQNTARGAGWRGGWGRGRYGNRGGRGGRHGGWSPRPGPGRFGDPSLIFFVLSVVNICCCCIIVCFYVFGREQVEARCRSMGRAGAGIAMDMSGGP